MTQRNRTTVRRAVRAGGAVALTTAVVTTVAAVSGAVPGATVIAATVALGSLVAAGWLLLAALLDVWAGEPPDVRRVAWTAGATLLAMLGPFLVLGTLMQPAGGTP